MHAKWKGRGTHDDRQTAAEEVQVRKYFVLAFGASPQLRLVEEIFKSHRVDGSGWRSEGVRWRGPYCSLTLTFLSTCGKFLLELVLCHAEQQAVCTDGVKSYHNHFRLTDERGS